MPPKTRIDVAGLRRAAVKLAFLGPRGWWLLLQAQWSILKAISMVKNRPQGALAQEIVTGPDQTGSGSPVDRARVEALGLAVDRMARLGLRRPLCLARSIALQRLLVRNGITGSRIRIGVRMKDQTFEAHAWVEWMGSVIGEDPDNVETFRPFTDLPTGPTPLPWADREGSS